MKDSVISVPIGSTRLLSTLLGSTSHRWVRLRAGGNHASAVFVEDSAGIDVVLDLLVSLLDLRSGFILTRV